MRIRRKTISSENIFTKDYLTDAKAFIKLYTVIQSCTSSGAQDSKGAHARGKRHLESQPCFDADATSTLGMRERANYVNVGSRVT
jgi:hypothetical protein